jgi:phosphoribosylformylglycinamidine (FGAM) synthase PurS component
MGGLYLRLYRVIVTVRDSIRDNQGIAVLNALRNSLGFSQVKNVRIGKTYTISLDDQTDINEIVKSFVNAVMEDYTIEELT